jgi:cbb3-type cytochrome oxidase maturation protein
MSIVYLLMPIALLLGLGFLAAFLWFSSRGEYEDLKTPAYRMLLDEERE